MLTVAAGAVLLAAVLALGLRSWLGRDGTSGIAEDPAVRARVSALAKALENPSAEVRMDALAALGRIEGPMARDMVLRALRDGEASVRAEAVKVLGERYRGSSEKMALTMLLRLAALLADDSAEAREAAAETLEALTGYNLARVDWRGDNALVRADVAREFTEWLRVGEKE